MENHIFLQISYLFDFMMEGWKPGYKYWIQLKQQLWGQLNKSTLDKYLFGTVVKGILVEKIKLIK